MKKKILILSSLIMFVLIVSIVTLFYSDNDKVIFESGKNNTVVRSNALTMMYETEAGSGEYQVSKDNTWPTEGYIFNTELSSCENGGTVSWNSETNRVVMRTPISDKCYVYFDVIPTFANDIINNFYVEDGVNGLYYHDGQGTYTNADQEAGDNSYRYSGANPNNFVCFGSDATTCPNDNLYRIIGIFDNQVKLIKHDYATTNLLGTDGAYYIIYSSSTGQGWDTSYYRGSINTSSLGVYFWNNGTNYNTWSESNLNTVNLNTNYLNNIGSTWASKIANVTWIVGGNTVSNIGLPAKQTYINEITNPAEATTYSVKIGLMYVSDYGYAAGPENWNISLYNYDNDTNRNNNWMFMGLNEWTITRQAGYTNPAFRITYLGRTDNENVYSPSATMRPTFYLNSDVQYVSGTGTQTDPFRIA